MKDKLRDLCQKLPVDYAEVCMQVQVTDLRRARRKRGPAATYQSGRT